MITHDIDNYNETFFRLWLHNIDGVYNNTYRILINHFKTAANVYNADFRELNNVLCGSDIALTIYNSRALEYTERLLQKLSSENISILHPLDAEYPDKLLHISAPPEILYIKGKLPKSINSSKNNIAIIGSRNPDSYGREYAKSFSYTLAKQGINIISGLAKGIDSYGHQGALAAGGCTIAVLGCGINNIYPLQNYKLYEEIPEKGAIISEYAPNTPPNAYQFPERNRIISALSDGILVVEAKKKSGSLITCNHALAQGKPIYAIPGRIGDALSEGTNALIYDGALCTTCPEDIIECLKGEVTDREELYDKNTAALFSPDEIKIISLLSLDDTYVDTLINRSGLGVTKTINTLLTLREKGVIKETAKGYYIRNIMYKSI